MTNQHDIFKRLAEFEVNPPSELWSQILRSVESSAQLKDDFAPGSFAAVQDIAVQPPSEAYHFIIRKIEDPHGFYKLYDVEETPPKNIVNRLFDIIHQNKSKQQTGKSIIRKLYDYRLTAAASLLLFIIAGWLLYKSVNKEGLTEKPGLAKKKTPAISIPKDSTFQLVATDKKEATNEKKTIKLNQAPLSVATVMIGEYSYKFNFTDNDMLASFANFTNATAPPFLTDDKESKPFFIQVDQFTAIAVSEPMSAMMKRMNSFRKNGKPTPKARRERRRLESWKKADEKRFDTKMNNNPLDAMDLAELFFTNQLLNLLVMATPKSVAIFIICVFTFSFSNQAQDSVKVQRQNIPDVTISYAIELKSGESNNGIGETYNGGVKTVFISDNKARVRLVSLMRMQSVFVLPAGDAHGVAAIVKESGKGKYKTYLSPGEWKAYNSKYDSAVCFFSDDSTTILGYRCRKAIIQLPDNRTIRVYYTDSIRNDFFHTAEPSFHCIPGIVLQYEYTHRKGTISYTATNISTAAIAKDVFKVPAKGYGIKKFSKTAAAGADGAVQVE